MDTLVTVAVVTHQPRRALLPLVERASRWFGAVEAACSRFDPDSEVSQLARHPGTPVRVGEILLRATATAIAVARASGGAFDPTVGAALAQRGFDREYRTGTRVRTVVPEGGSWRDIQIDWRARTITLHRPLVLDLGALAKGLAVDLALGELAGHPSALVEGGGDLRVRGVNERGELWQVGVRDPRGRPGTVLRPGSAAVCTSGGYARRTANGEHHLLDPRTGASANAALSATVIAPTAAAADALSTAAFVLGPKAGIELLARERVEGFLVTHGDVYGTPPRG